MLGGDAELRGRASRRPVGAGRGPRGLGRAVAIARRVATGGTLALRLLATGILLFVGLPILTMLLYIWGYPATPVPPLVVILVDVLQLLIVAYAVVVGAQLVTYAAVVATQFGRGARRRAPAAWGERTLSEEVRAKSAEPSAGWAGVREWPQRLVEMIWLQEQRGRPEFGSAALAYVHDAVTVELEHRRRAEALDRRAAELEAWTTRQDSVVASERM